LKGQWFNSVEEIQLETLAALSSVPQLDFHCCFETWKKWWTGCVNHAGDYFEGDHA
jgi:hypothetical protein